MSEDVIDNLAKRIIELDHEVNTAIFVDVSEEDTSALQLMLLSVSINVTVTGFCCYFVDNLK